jgi:hypothetical protein
MAGSPTGGKVATARFSGELLGRAGDRGGSLTAHSADPDQPFRPIAITDSGTE